MKSKKVTYKQLMDYIEQLEIQLKNNQQAVYDVSQVLTDYVELRGKAKALNTFMQKKHLGSSTGIPTRWSVFSKYCKDRYLQLKKVLAYIK